MLAFAVSGLPGPAHAQGIPTIDVANIAQAILMNQSLQQQVTTQAQQYQTLASQLAAQTGNRALGQILNDPSLRNYLPDQWQSIYDQVKSGQLQGISGAAQRIQQAEGMTASTPGQQRYIDAVGANKAMSMQAYDATLKRLQNIEGLMRRSDLTQDPAEKADLLNRLSAENAMIQNEQVRLNLMAKLQDVEERLAAKQASEELRKKFLAPASF
ncbi:type IV secretion system protein [Cupriavidus sp. CP313]